MGGKEEGLCVLWNPALDVCLEGKEGGKVGVRRREVGGGGGRGGWVFRRLEEEGGGGGGGQVMWLGAQRGEGALSWVKEEKEWRLLLPSSSSSPIRLYKHTWMGHDPTSFPFRLISLSSLRCLCDCSQDKVSKLLLLLLLPPSPPHPKNQNKTHLPTQPNPT